MSSIPQSSFTFPFLLLPLELRCRIYSQLVSVKHARTPKNAQACLRSTTFYNWNLDPTILRVNRQINQEAKDVMRRENDFVVIERAEALKQEPNDMYIDTKVEYNIELWPGKATRDPVVPGKRMRMALKRKKASKTAMDAHVILASELRIVCARLSTFLVAIGGYRTSKLFCEVKVHPPTYTETPADRDIRERSLLEPLHNLRDFQSVSIQGALPTINYQTIRQLTHQELDHGLVLTTIDELITDGDHASRTGCHDIATAYYQRADEYMHHILTYEGHLFTGLGILVFQFKTKYHSALNWIHDDKFLHAYNAAGDAILLADKLFSQGSPMPANSTKDWKALISWRCQQVKEGAARLGQKIKAEDIGRCYYYMSIAIQMLHGGQTCDEVNTDRLLGIRCCDVSETMTDDVPGELLQLEIQTMRSYKETIEMFKDEMEEKLEKQQSLRLDEE